MPGKTRDQKLQELRTGLAAITDGQLEWIDAIIAQFKIKPVITRNPESTLVTPCVAEGLADAFQIHHSLSNEALSKDRFEYAFERVLNRCKVSARLAKRGNPGHDITIQGVPYSLKTQADRSIKAGFLHVSKFMELGKGAWIVEEDLKGLRDRFFVHMRSYDRILQLRRITNRPELQVYELVEIPKTLLAKAVHAECKLDDGSSQSPKPGRCEVTENGVKLFDLYFDGGTERKLQIQSLDKRHCLVHAEWRIRRNIAKAEDAAVLPLADDAQ
jgi:type II restriction enzyme